MQIVLPLRITCLALALAATGFSVHSQAQTPPTQAATAVERDGAGQSLDDLYQAALKEGGQLTVYAGGDEVTQGFGIQSNFERRFPGMKINIVVDLSKYHDARIEE